MKPYDRPTDSLPISRRTVIKTPGWQPPPSPASAPVPTIQPPRPASHLLPPLVARAVQPDHSPSRKQTYPVGSGKIFPDAQTVITQPKKGEFKAFSAVCTHQGCLVDAVTTTIDCPCHGSKYSITDGSVVNPPAPQPLPPRRSR